MAQIPAVLLGIAAMRGPVSIDLNILKGLDRKIALTVHREFGIDASHQLVISVTLMTPLDVDVLLMQRTCPGLVTKYSGKLFAATYAPVVEAIVTAVLSVTEI
jgi:hypothetical protein